MVERTRSSPAERAPVEEGRLPVIPEIYTLRPWYHDFSRLGLRTDFGEWSRPRDRMRRILTILGSRLLRGACIEKGERLLSFTTLWGGPNSHRVNQRAKESWLVPWLECCLADLGDNPRCLDLFCADGYYSCWMASMRPDAAILGVDLDSREIRRARAAAGALGLGRARFVVGDARGFLDSLQERQSEGFDLVFLAGGLYHVSTPREILERAVQATRRFLVLQSVVTLETDEPDYFVTPAPGWRHGCRFSHARLSSWLQEIGWRIVAQRRDELPGNRRKSDRGSSSFLCEAPGKNSV